MNNEFENKKLDNPLVVHKKGDASYHNDNEIEMNQTLDLEKNNTLERHRFKKDPDKKGHKGIVILAIIVVLVAAFCGLYFTGNISFGEKETTTEVEATEEQTTTVEQLYEGTIVIKDTYIFVDGLEVNGIDGLQSALRYKDASDSAYIIITDNANDNYFNNNVLPVLMDMGFYGENTEIKHKSTSLVPVELLTTVEQTEAPTAEETETE